MKLRYYFLPIIICIAFVGFEPAYSQQDDLVWSTHFGGEKGVALIRDIEVGKDGNVYSVGESRDSADLNPGSSSAILSNLDTRSFIQKMDSSGQFEWAVELAGLDGKIDDVKLDAQENVFVFGEFESEIKIYPQDSVIATAPTGLNGFVAKFSTSGQLIWVRHFESSNAYLEAVAVAPNGGCIFAGMYSDFIDLIPNQPGGEYTDLIKGNNAFLIEFDPNGNPIWHADLAGQGQYDYVSMNEMEFDASGNLVMTGHFVGTSDFDPDPQSQHFENAPNQRAMHVMKLDANRDFQWVKTFKPTSSSSLCITRAMTIDPQGNAYFASNINGTFEYQVGGGMDSIVVNESNIMLASVSANGVVSFAKTVGEPITNLRDIIDIVYAPDQTIRAAGNNDCCSGFAGNFDLNGNLIKSLKFSGMCGPDARGIGVDVHGHMYVGGFFMQNVNIDMGDGFYDTLWALPFDGFVAKYKTCDLEISISQDAGGLSSQGGQTNLQYQWYDCVSGEPIPGATSFEFNPTEIGYYKLKVSDGNCTDFSECQAFYPLGVDELDEGAFAVYPNPSAGEVFIETPSAGTVQCLTANGRLVFEQQTNGQRMQLNTDELEKGVYFLRFNSDQQPQVIRMVRSE